MKFFLVVLALATVVYGSAYNPDRKIVDSYNDDSEIMNVKNINVVKDRGYDGGYGSGYAAPKYESRKQYGSSRYENEGYNDDDFFGRGANNAFALAFDDDVDDGYSYDRYGGYGNGYINGDRDNNRNRNRNRNANANANANRDENRNRNRNDANNKNAVEDKIYVSES